MALLVPSEGEAKMINLILGKASAENLYLRLYTNNKTPAEGDTKSDYTEASSYGYAAKDLAAAAWTVTTGDPSYAVTAQQVFTFTGALGNVYGYFLEGKVSGVVYWAELFSGAPYNIQNNGDEIRVTPRFELA